MVDDCDLNVRIDIKDRGSFYSFTFNRIYPMAFYRDEKTNEIYICLDDVYRLFELYDNRIVLKDKKQFILDNQKEIKEIYTRSVDDLFINRFSIIYEKIRVEFVTLKGLDILFNERSENPIVFFHKWVKQKAVPYIRQQLTKNLETEYSFKNKIIKGDCLHYEDLEKYGINKELIDDITSKGGTITRPVFGVVYPDGKEESYSVSYPIIL